MASEYSYNYADTPWTRFSRGPHGELVGGSVSPDSSMRHHAGTDMPNARFGRLLSREEMAELAREQRIHDARSRARAEGRPPPVLDENGREIAVMTVRDEQAAERRRAAREYIASGRGGQGDFDSMLGDRMNPLTTAAMFIGGPPATAMQAAKAAAFTLGTMAGIESLAERHPTAAKAAQMGLMFAGIPGAGRAAKRLVGKAFNNAMAEPTAQKLNLLKAMLDAYTKTGQPISEEAAAIIESAAGADRAVAAAQGARRTPTRTTWSVDDLPRRRASDIGAEVRFTGWENPTGKFGETGVPPALEKAPYVINPASGSPAVPGSAKQGPLPSKGPIISKGPLLVKGNSVPVDNEAPPPAGPFDPQELLTPPQVKPTWGKPDQAAQDRWYSKLVERFGEDTADYIRHTFNSKFFDRYFYGDDPETTMGLYKKYETLRSIYDKIAEPNRILLGGSSSIGSEGTILRNEIGHDLDFQANIANASGRTDIGTPEATAAMVAALKNRANVENAPIIQKLRRLYPQLANAKFRYAQRKFQWWGDDKYQPDVFTVPIPEPSTTPTGEVNLMVNVLLDGQKVDLMLTDSAMPPSKANPRLGQAQTALHWKSAYLQEAAAKGRPLTKGQLKHQADLARYREYSRDNMLVDPRSRRAQYAPFDFPENRLIDEDGMPVVGEMETFPGSGERIPVFMNAQGRILPAEDPNMLTTWYDPQHPQNNPRYANPPATRDTHPLVAIRGAEQFLRAPRGENTGVDRFPGRGFQHGEPAPGIGIYPANNPELLVDEIIKGGRWSTYYNGKHKDMIFYPREAVDPMANSGNVLHAEDAYWGNPWNFNTGGIADRAAALGTPEAIDALGRYFGRTARIPERQFTEIGNAYRNYLYEMNPEGHYNQPPNIGGNYDGYGEARHLGRVPDGVVVPGKLIDSDPEKARAMMLDLVKKGMFLLPGAAGALGSGDEETQQAAKAGDADRFSTARNFLATDEVPETLFGIPVAADEGSWTDRDIEFFRKHPEAGGYYDMGDDDEEEQPPEEQPPEEQSVQAAEGAGDTPDETGFVLNGNLKTQGRMRYLFRDDEGKVMGYGTQRSTVAQDTDGTWVAIPTIVDGREPMSEDAAFEHYRRTGEFFHRGKTKEEADAGARAAHSQSQEQDLAWWNNYLADHMGDGTLSEKDEGLQKALNDPGFIRWASGQEKGAYERKPGDSDAQLRVERRRRAILDGRIEPNAIDRRAMPAGELNRARKARRIYINKRRADMGPGGLKADSKGGNTAKKTPPPIVKGPLHYGPPPSPTPQPKRGEPKPIVKGPLRYGPPPPPSRGAYPGSLNNPGNVERRAKRRRGEVDSPHARWSKFATPQDGLREAADVVRQIADVKLAGAGLPFTIRNWANVYAPEKNRKGEKENDTEKYIRDISSTSGLDADAALDRNNTDDMARLLKTIVRFESGAPHSEWFTDDEYRQAALAMQEGAID